MAFKVVYRQQGLVARHRQRLGRHQADDHPADQPRPGGGRHRIAIGQRHARLAQHPFHQRGEPFGMGARSDFGHHAAIGRVFCILAGDGLRHESRDHPSPSAAAVSSQELSMPRTSVIPLSLSARGR